MVDSQPGGQPILSHRRSVPLSSVTSHIGPPLVGPRSQIAEAAAAGFLRGSVWFCCWCSWLSPRPWAKRQQVIVALAPICRPPKLPSFPDRHATSSHHIYNPSLPLHPDRKSYCRYTHRILQDAADRALILTSSPICRFVFLLLSRPSRPGAHFITSSRPALTSTPKATLQHDLACCPLTTTPSCGHANAPL
jgi:hypothetical protein